MKIIDLMEGATPKLPGAGKGIQIMTPQQFIAKSAMGEEPDKEVDEGWKEKLAGAGLAGAMALGAAGAHAGDHSKTSSYTSGPVSITQTVNAKGQPTNTKYSADLGLGTIGLEKEKGITTKSWTPRTTDFDISHKDIYSAGDKDKEATYDRAVAYTKNKTNEATKLPADTRELKGQELEDYLERIRKQEKKKTDKYNLPYIHRSSVVKYYNEAGKRYDTDAIKDALKERPKSLLKKNEKMKHSDGTDEQFFNIGFAALVGIALDEQTNELIVVNTCPGAGSCKVDCFAMKGGKVQFQGPWLSDGKILTYLLNDPDSFFTQLKSEISKEEQKGKKGNYKVSIRWHDAGDFFSPEYVDMAFKLAQSLPDVQFYAYTKVADVALGDKPKNFIINWSEGAHTSQEKKVKAVDPELEKTKNSRIVPSDLFYDLLVKDEKKNLVKGEQGQWQVIPDKLPELKQRLAKAYKLSPSSILSYDEWDSKTKGGKEQTPIKYNVIITPGEPDITAKSHGVLSTLLLKH